jgi:acyl carrier protein
MPDLESRLIKCFSSVFPALMPEEIQVANAQSLAAWDSLAAVTLAAVVQQEFSVQIDLLDLPELDSFAAFQTYLRRLTARSGADRSQ